MQSGVVNKNTALCHHLFEGTQAQGISEIPANTLSDNISGVCRRRKAFRMRDMGRQHRKKNSMLPDDALMRQNRFISRGKMTVARKRTLIVHHPTPNNGPK